MKELSRYNVSGYYLNHVEYNELSELVSLYHGLLKDVETDFLTDDASGISDKIVEYDSVYSIIQNNIDKNPLPSKYEMDYSFGKKWREPSSDVKNTTKTAYYLFARYLKSIRYMANNYVNLSLLNLDKYPIAGKRQVFLSHAYQDKLYTILLFHYFYNKEIYLYIDWMHQGEESDGQTLKHNLYTELSKSDQLLFLRSVNSELNIQGKHYVRPWCSWELGNYYALKKSYGKYILNLYSIDGYTNNLQLHGMSPFRRIENGRLI